MGPLFSICVPTYNRADLLDDFLGRLRAFERSGEPFEVVVSDNASTDKTPEVLERRKTEMPYLRSIRQLKTVDPVANFFNAMRNGRGEALVYAADDDSIIPEVLMTHVRRMRDEPDLNYIYADVIAYDDENEREMHRYAHYPQPASFGPNNPMELLNFVFRHQVYPETGVYRRDPFLHYCPIIKYGRIPFHMWMYRLSRTGRIAFELNPFYREHQVLKRRFRRDNWSNMDIRLQYIGDELRCMLESISLLALQDSGIAQVPPDQVLNLKVIIDKFLHNRTSLEIQRAAMAKNWILAVELRRRMALWYGPGSQQEQAAEVMNLVFPAAMQHMRESYDGMSDVTGLMLKGFRTNMVKEFIATHFPDVRLIDAAELAEDGVQRPLILHRDSPQVSESPYPGYEFYLDRLMNNYRISTIGLNLAEL